MRVALVCPYSLSRPGGVQTQVVGLAGAFQHRGHEVSVLAPLDDGMSPLPPAIELVVTGRSVPLPANGSVAPVTVSPLAVRRGVRALRSTRPDVVHVHEPFAPGVPLGLLVAGGLPPEVATFHRSGSSLFYRGLGPVVRRLGRRLAARCAVSVAARTTAASAVDGDIEVLFNGVDCDRYARADPWPSHRPVVLFLGRHEARKGLGVLLEAFDRLRGSGGADDGGGAGRAELWVAGDGPATAELRRRWPPDEDIRWLGTLTEDEKVRRLAAAEVLCAPSLGQESFGLVLLEAMAAGTVVVASDIPGYRDAAGGRAVLVPPGRADALADALAAVLEGRRAMTAAETSSGTSSPGEASSRRRWLDEARDRASAFSMERLADRYEAIYAAVIEGRPAGRS
jgi:phosphatidylinositol alpha-mannosyltransferase